MNPDPSLHLITVDEAIARLQQGTWCVIGGHEAPSASLIAANCVTDIRRDGDTVVVQTESRGEYRVGIVDAAMPHEWRILLRQHYERHVQAPGQTQPTLTPVLAAALKLHNEELKEAISKPIREAKEAEAARERKEQAESSLRHRQAAASALQQQFGAGSEISFDTPGQAIITLPPHPAVVIKVSGHAKLNINGIDVP